MFQIPGDPNGSTNPSPCACDFGSRLSWLIAFWWVTTASSIENQCDCRSILSKPAITLNFLKKITRLVKFLLAVWGFELGKREGVFFSRRSWMLFLDEWIVWREGVF